MSNRIRYTRDDVTKNVFYQMPKFLLTGEFKNLNNDARVLYSVLKDRHELSLKNEWTNEKGEVYIIFSRVEMCEMLGLTEKTVRKAMNALKEYNLVEEEHIGFGKLNKIYLLTVNSTILPQRGKISRSVGGKFPVQEVENFPFIPYSNTDSNNKTNHSQRQGNGETIDNDLDNDFYDYESTKQKIHDNICYAHYQEHYKSDIGLINELVDCMLDVILTEGDTVKLNGENKNRQMVVSQYLKINPSDIELILSKYKEQSHKITHIHNYLKTMLYTVKQEQGHYYTNAVNADGWNDKVQEL